MHISLWREKIVLEREEMEAETSRNPSPVTDINLLPEIFIAEMLSLTSPPETCRLSLVGSTFRSAAESDTVWERFLPSDYQDMIARASEQPVCASKKKLYFSLSDHPLIIDDGTKSFSLDKWSGKKCFMLAARSLTIIWGDTPKYWRWISLPDESRFTEVAELVDVCWLEIRGRISTLMLSPDTTYAAYLVFKWATRVYGFHNRAAKGRVGLIGSEGERRSFYLDCDGNDQHPKERGDGWLEMELGRYLNQSREDGELEICLQGTEGLYWKSGLILQGIEIRPNKVVNK